VCVCVILCVCVCVCVGVCVCVCVCAHIHIWLGHVWLHIPWGPREYAECVSRPPSLSLSLHLCDMTPIVCMSRACPIFFFVVFPLSLSLHLCDMTPTRPTAKEAYIATKETYISAKEPTLSLPQTRMVTLSSSPLNTFSAK